MYIVFPDVALASRYSTTASYGFAANTDDGAAAVQMATATSAPLTFLILYGLCIIIPP